MTATPAELRGQKNYATLPGMRLRLSVATFVKNRVRVSVGRCLLLILLVAGNRVLVSAPIAPGPGTIPGYIIVGLGQGPYNRLCFAATVEGHKGLMMLDTGAGGVLLNKDKYQFLLPAGNRKLPPGVPAYIPVNDTKSPVGIAHEFRIAQVELGTVPVALVEHRLLYDVGMLYVNNSDRQYDGLIGETVLRHYNAVVDCARLGLYLNIDPAHKHDFGPAFVRAGWTRIPMENLSNDFTVSCKINGRSFRMIVDTGAPWTDLDKNLVSGAQLSIHDLPMRGGVIGARARDAAFLELSGFQIGSYAAPRTDAIVTDGLRGYFGGNNSAKGQPVIGLLGSDFLSTNGAIVDVGNHALYLKAGVGTHPQ